MKGKFSALLTGVALVSAVGLLAAGCQTDDYSYKRVPKDVHQTNYLKGHDGSKNCYYNENEAVYFCQY